VTKPNQSRFTLHATREICIRCGLSRSHKSILI